MKKIIKKLIWFLKGKPNLSYCGFHCGLCGKWVWEKFTIPTYLSVGEAWDTVGICDKCTK